MLGTLPMMLAWPWCPPQSGCTYGVKVSYPPAIIVLTAPSSAVLKLSPVQWVE